MRFPISLPRFALVWIAMAVAMSANGVFRELVLKRATTSTAANVLSAGLGILLIALITRVGFRPLGSGEWALTRIDFLRPAATAVVHDRGGANLWINSGMAALTQLSSARWRFR
jgi:hypothetical protein